MLKNVVKRFKEVLIGNCGSLCSSLAMEDDIQNIKSLRIKLHLFMCKNCWKYFKQLSIVDTKISSVIKNNSNKNYDLEEAKNSLIDKYHLIKFFELGLS